MESCLGNVLKRRFFVSYHYLCNLHIYFDPCPELVSRHFCLVQTSAEFLPCLFSQAACAVTLGVILFKSGQHPRCNGSASSFPCSLLNVEFHSIFEFQVSNILTRNRCHSICFSSVEVRVYFYPNHEYFKTHLDLNAWQLTIINTFVY